jgi:hypothetical protein
MKNNQTVYYQTLCGCLLQREDLIPGPSSKNRRLMCPEHHGEIDSKFTHCIQCGKEIRVEKKDIQVRLPLRCQTCFPARVHNTKAKRQTAINQNEFDMLIKRSDCVYRPLCAEVFIKKNQLPCETCKEYVPMDALDTPQYGLNLSELDDYIKKGMEEWGMMFVKRLKDLMLKK